MKLLITGSVSALALFAAAPAFAQSTSTITQNGSGNVVIDQAGSRGSRSDVTTLAGPATLGTDEVRVTQRDSGTGPNGQANYSYVNQDNVNLGTRATVEQYQTYDGYDRNYSSITQGRNASHGTVYTRQEGGNNSSTYSAFTSQNNTGDIRQTGANNTSNVTQNFQDGSQAYVTQIGGIAAANSATIQQIGVAYNQQSTGDYAQATQNGNGHTSVISQTGYTTPASNANWARSVQNDYGQYSSIGQSGVNNTADVSQSGFMNASYLTQSGNSNDSGVTQSGSNNMSDILQSANGGVIRIDQSSSGNKSYVTQSGGGTSNVALVTQSSANNYSSINQTSSNAYSSVFQH